mgnify:CR=1 FL=1
MALHVVDHPLVRHKLGLLRRESTSTSEFRMVAKEIGRLLTYEATRELQTETKSVQGWAGPVNVDYISGKKVTIVPILRAGLGLMDGVLDMVPGAKISVCWFNSSIFPTVTAAKFAPPAVFSTFFIFAVRLVC